MPAEFFPRVHVGKVNFDERQGNAQDGVTWVQSYVTHDKMKTFCIYDAPSPEAIRKVAQRNSLPVDSITEVSVLDPYFYK